MTSKSRWSESSSFLLPCNTWLLLGGVRFVLLARPAQDRRERRHGDHVSVDPDAQVLRRPHRHLLAHLGPHPHLRVVVLPSVSVSTFNLSLLGSGIKLLVIKNKLGTPACPSYRLSTCGPQTLKELTWLQKKLSCAVIHCLTSVKIAEKLWCHPGTFSEACIGLDFLECSTLFCLLWLRLLQSEDSVLFLSNRSIA